MEMAYAESGKSRLFYLQIQIYPVTVELDPIRCFVEELFDGGNIFIKFHAHGLLPNISLYHIEYVFEQNRIYLLM